MDKKPIPLKVIKKPDDLSLGEKVLRISIGGNLDKGIYITYRGDLGEVQDLLRIVTGVFTELKEEPPITVDEKNFA